MSTTSTDRPHLAEDIWSVLVRELRPVLRDPFSVVFSLLQPIMFLTLFSPLLSSMTGASTAESLQWFVPGIIVMSTLFGTAMAGSNLLFELQSGSHERMLVTPVARPAFLIGRALKEMVPLVIQAVVLTAIATLMGFRPVLTGMLAGLLMLGVFGVGLGALSYALGIASRKRDWMFWTVQQALIFPLMILSGMLLPLDESPSWLRTLAAVNPLTYLVDAERALFAGEFGAAAIWQGGLAAVAVAALGLVVGIRAMRRSI